MAQMCFLGMPSIPKPWPVEPVVARAALQFAGVLEVRLGARMRTQFPVVGELGMTLVALVGAALRCLWLGDAKRPNCLPRHVQPATGRAVEIPSVPHGFPRLRR